MKQIPQNQKSEYRKHCWALSLLINAAVLGILLLLFCPKYGNLIDVTMQNLLYGTIPELKMSHIFFSNILLGKLLSVLIGLIPAVPWYTVVQYMLLFIALSATGYIILRRARGAMGIVIACFVLIFLGYHVYVCIDYLRTACLLTASGFTLYLHTVERSRRRISFESVLAAVLALSGSLYSFKAFLIVATVCLFLNICYLMFEGKQALLPRLIIVMCIVALVCGGLYTIDRLAYRDNANFRNALAYRGVFEKLFTYGTNAKFDDALKIYGIADGNQLNALINGTFLNGTRYGLSRLTVVANQSRPVTSQVIDTFFKQNLLSLFNIDIFYLWFGLMVLVLAFSKRKARILIPTLAAVLVMLFVCYVRYSTNGRVYFMIFVPAALHLLLYIHATERTNWKPAVAFLMVFFVILYSRFSKDLLTSVRQDDMQVAFDSIDEADEERYLIDLDRYAMSFSALTRYPADLVPEQVYVVNGFYATMTGYSPERYQLEKDSDQRWLYNSAKLSAFKLPDYDPVPNEELEQIMMADLGIKGEGTAESPYRIASAENLATLARLVNKKGQTFKDVYFRQTKDIDLSAYRNWKPIGLYTGETFFEGTYDGDCHVIENLTINGKKDNKKGNVGLFGRLNGTVINLGIKSGTISGHCVGSIASHGSGIIANCWNMADVTGSHRAGGICDNFSGYVIYCWNGGQVNGKNTGQITSYSCNFIYGCAAKSGKLVNKYFSGNLLNSGIHANCQWFVSNALKKDEYKLQNLDLKDKWSDDAFNE